MDIAAITLLDPAAAAIVLGGTLIGSVMAHGSRNLRIAAREAAALADAALDQAANRAALSRVLIAIKRDGRHAADAPLPPDTALAQQVAAYLRLGDLAPMHDIQREQSAAAKARRNAAVMVWRAAGELAPVAGLVGTLYAITGLVPEIGAGLAATTASAIATAVVSTLYGLLLAHLVCLPVAGAIIRRAAARQAARARLMAWFESQLPKAPPATAHPRPAAVWDQAA